MRIENNTSNQIFGRAYIDMKSLNKYGQSLYFANGRSKIITALKDLNTPLRKFINEVINTPKFEKEYGDVFISFNRQKHFGEGEDLFDMVHFKFPKLQKKAQESMANFLNRYNKWTKSLNATARKPYIEDAEKDTIYSAGFRDLACWAYSQDGAEELQKYLKSSEIVEHLSKHIKKLKP